MYGQDTSGATTIPFGRTKASAMLDLLRGLAALLVCVSHWRNIFFEDYGESGRALATLPFYVLTSYGHQAVMVFFVLSGYLIAGTIRRSVARGKWNWPGYAVQRLTRLWVVLLPGLLLCALLDYAGMHSGWAPRLYAGLSGDHIVRNVGADLSWSAFGRTLFFLQGVSGRTFGSDGPLWSVGYEFWYYVMFPLGLFLFIGGVRAWVRVGFAGLLVAIAILQGRELLVLFPVWLVGAGLTYLPRCRAGVGARWGAMIAYMPVFLLAGHLGEILGRPELLAGVVGDYVVAMATVGLIWVLLSARQEKTDAVWERAGHRLARFSFTLYVTHVPLLVLLAAWAERDRRWAPDAAHLLLATGLLSLVLGFAWAVAWATEFRTDSVRRWVGRLLVLQM